MSALKKALGGGVLALIVGFVTEWLDLLHVEAFVHIDWEAGVSKEARVWSVIVVIILYLILTFTKASPKILGRVTLVFAAACAMALGACYIYAGAVPGAQANVANQMIATWHHVFVLADVLAVCTGLTFGMYLAS